RALDAAAARPAAAFGLAGVKGAIEVGADADLVLASFDDNWIITEDGVLSRCGWTPYSGRSCSVRIDTTFLRGEPVYANGRVVGEAGRARLAAPR
ncbi:MAG: amidohydrolase family protein, partial [Mycobacteriales bacterium]